MIVLEKVLAELEAESLSEAVVESGTNYCLLGAGSNYCLVGFAQPNTSTSHENLSRPDPSDDALNLTPVNYCLF